MIKFVGLHAHSLSIGDSIGYPEDHFKFVIENAGEDSMGLAITDHGSAISYGYMIQAHNNLKKKNIPFKPIFGFEAYFHPDLDQWAEEKKAIEAKKDDEDTDLVVENESESKDKNRWYNPVNRRHHLVIIAQNKEGFENINKLISWSYKNGFYRYPRIDAKILEKYNKGLIISTACLAGLPSFLILREKDKGDEAVFASLNKELKPVLDIFGPERAYLELQFNKIPEQKIVNDYLAKYSQQTGYNLISTADSHYARPEWWKARELYKMMAQQTKGWKVSKDDLPKSIEDLKCELYPKNGDQMFASYKNYNPELDEKIVRESIERTYDIAHNMCEMVVPDGSFKLPISRKDITPEQRLRDISWNAFREKGLENLYEQRLIMELDVICKKGYANYFLVLRDAINEIQKELITGCGRGSGAGSLVCYLLGITKIDPVKNNLLFERFLSENRNEAPDIDNDVEDRDSTIGILRRLYGDDNVVAISNFNTLQLKSLIKDLCKVEGIEFEEVNEVTSKMEDEARPRILEDIGHDQKLYVFDLDGALKHSPTFKKFTDKYPSILESIKILFRQIRVISMHAGGLVITEDPESKFQPKIKIRGNFQTSWSDGLTAKHLEQFGLIKYDFLGLATLRIIRNCIELILRKELSKEPTFDQVNSFYQKYLHPDVIGDGEKEVFREIYHKGKFASIFQFTEKGVQEFCQKARPCAVSDISAITALWRPGPLKGGADLAYLDAVENGNIKYDHPILEQILGATKGTLLYQEQFMLLAHHLAGFSLLESDELRKLLVKPVTSLGEEMKKKRIDAGERFISGCIKSGLSEKRAETLWNDEILGFISYGFNKSLHKQEKVTIYDCGGGILNLISIENVQPGMLIRTRNEKTQIDEFAAVKARHDHGIIDVYEIELDDGRKVKCTLDHKFRVEDGRMLPIWQIMKENLSIVALDVESK